MNAMSVIKKMMEVSKNMKEEKKNIVVEKIKAICERCEAPLLVEKKIFGFLLCDICYPLVRNMAFDKRLMMRM